MNNNHHLSLEPSIPFQPDPINVTTTEKTVNRKMRRNFDRIKRKAKKSFLKVGMKVK